MPPVLHASLCFLTNIHIRETEVRFRGVAKPSWEVLSGTCYRGAFGGLYPDTSGGAYASAGARPCILERGGCMRLAGSIV